MESNEIIADGESKSWTAKPKILIIGGGISGIAAGEYLSRKGLTDFKILEATPRTGGRIWSVSVDDEGHKAEMGANWIHGIERNPIYQIADKNHLLELRHADRNLRRRDLHLSEDGELINDKMVKEVDFSYGMLIAECEDFFHSGMPTPEDDDSVGAHLEREFQEKLDKYSNGDRRMRQMIFDQRILLECCITGCDNMTDVSLEEFGCYEELPGVHYTIPPGFEAVLEILKKNIPDDNILLNKPVKCIDWSNCENNKSSQVCVECENGEKFYANHVICTVSIGVLKAACDRMFYPPLPKDKQKAIQSLGFGIVDKVILEFDKTIVESDVFRIELLWDRDIKEKDLRKTWMRKIYSFEVVHENILVGWLAGKEALFMESLSEDQIAEDCRDLLRKFLKNNDIPLPKRVIRTRWGNNPYTRGSYSYLAIGARQKDIMTLQEPLTLDENSKPPVLFAGEATHTTFYSTTHGALLTGYREAQRIVNLYSK